MKHTLLLVLLAALPAFAQPGIIDTSFGTNGKVVTSMGANNNNSAFAVAIQPDGKIIVAGTYISPRGDNDYALVRYNANGTIDQTFGIDGKAITDFVSVNNNYSYIHSIHLQPDGKIIVLGATGMQGFFPQIGIVRYNADGTMDSGFGNNGKIISELAPYGTYGSKLLLLPDGKFLITSLKFYQGDPDYYIGIERYTAEGLIDTSFGAAGQAVTSWGAGQNISASMALLPDGRFVIAGTYIQNGNSKLALAQFNANGSLDTSFSADGKVITNFGAGTYAFGYSVFTNPDGKVTATAYVTSQSARNLGVVQYNANGVPDAGFDGDGMVVTPVAADDDCGATNAVVRQADGKFIVVAQLTNTMLQASDFVIRRYNTNGTADVGFGTNGRVATTFDTGLNEAQAATVTPEGKIVVVGRSTPEGGAHAEFALAQYNADGSLDTSFANGGKATEAFEKGNDELKIVLALPDDKLIAIGTSAYRQSNNTLRKHIVLCKYNANGSQDTTFGTSGKVYSVFGENWNTVITAALQPDGKILVSNMYGLVGQLGYSYEIIRYNADGSLDTAFGAEGKVSTDFTVTGIAFDAGGKILVSGNGYLEAGNYGYFVNRYTANGTLDTAFDADGKVFVPFSTLTTEGVTVLLQPDGKIVLSGAASYQDTIMSFAAVRLHANGSVDTSYGTNGVAWAALGDAFIFYRAFMQPDGKLIASGLSLGSYTNFASTRLNIDGMVDTTYGTEGIATSPLFEYRQVQSIVLQPDGKFLVALSKYNQPANSYDFVIRRFNPDGTFDDDFSGQYGIATSFYNGYDEAFSIALQSDYKIILAGSTFNGISKDFALARFSNDVVGTEDFEAIAADVIVYPNPVKNILHIKAGEGVEVISYAIYNMLGQVVYKNNSNMPEVNMLNFSNGVYTLQVNTNKGVLSRKFIKE